MVTYNEYPIIIAGEDKSGSTSETYHARPNKKWARIERIPITGPKLEHHSAVVFGGKVHTFGGYKDIFYGIDGLYYWKK